MAQAIHMMNILLLTVLEKKSVIPILNLSQFPRIQAVQVATQQAAQAEQQLLLVK